MKHETFHYPTLEALQLESKKLNAFIPLAEDVSALFQALPLAGKQGANRIAFQPMEGTDGTEDGAPGELTCRRYHRFAQAGPGLIWFEAVAALPQTRASAHQLPTPPVPKRMTRVAARRASPSAPTKRSVRAKMFITSF